MDDKAAEEPAADAIEPGSLDQARAEVKATKRAKKIPDGAAGRASRDKLQQKLAEMLAEQAQIHARRRTASEVDTREYERAYDNLVDQQSHPPWLNATIEIVQTAAGVAIGLAIESIRNGSGIAWLALATAVLLAATAIFFRYYRNR